MLTSLRLGVVASAALLIALLCGCRLLNRDRPISVLVADAETGRPVPGAEVRVGYARTGSMLAPSDGRVTAGTDGIAKLSASPAEGLGATVTVAATGYLSEEKFLTPKTIEAIEPSSLFTAAKASPPTLTLALYQGPRPTVQLIVPDGYRGVINAEIKIDEAAHFPPGTRTFDCDVSPSGEARLIGPALLHRVDFPDFSAKYSNGTAIPRGGAKGDVALWGLSLDRDHYTFLVGTKSEYDLKRPAIRSGDGGGSGDGQQKGGRGGGGRHGGGGRRGGGGM